MLDLALFPEETLDPADWDGFRGLAHRMLDDALDYQQTLRQRPVWQPVPAAAKAALDQPLPQEPQDAEAVYEDFRSHVLPYPMGNIHPRFWGWVMGGGTPFGVMAELLAATMNPNMGGGDHGGVYVERQVLDWCKQMLGFPANASGLLVSGGSMANFVALAAARNTQAEFDLRASGLTAAPRRMVLYASSEVHNSVLKAAQLLGLGEEGVRRIPVDGEYRLVIPALAAAIAADRAAGRLPFCVVGCAGTVNTGAFDDLQALAALCQRENLWFHVDGAFGALAAIAPGLEHLTAGMEAADSVAFDLHKWLYMPFEIGCVLVRDAAAHRQTFAHTPAYLAHHDRGVAGGDLWFSDYGLQLTRGFRALKAWMSLKEHGVAKYGRLIRQNVDQAGYLAGLVDAAPDLERLAPAPLNIVCFRYNPGGLDDAELNALNQEILFELHERGLAVPTYTTLGGKYALRVANTNHRSRREDFDLLIESVRRLGPELRAAGRGQEPAHA